MQPSSMPTNDPFVSVQPQSTDAFGTSTNAINATDFFSKDPFGAPFADSNKDAFGTSTAPFSNDPFASDPFGASSFSTSAQQPASGDPFSSGFGDSSNPADTFAATDSSSVYDVLKNNASDLPVAVSANQFSAAPATSSDLVYSSLNSNTDNKDKAAENSSNPTLDHVYADLSKNTTDAFGGPKSLDWFLSQPPEKEKNSSASGKNTVSSEHLDLRRETEYGDVLTEANYQDLRAQMLSHKDHVS